jgi:hypothetical protein
MAWCLVKYRIRVHSVVFDQARGQPFTITSNNLAEATLASPRVVTGEKNNPTVAHACRKRRLKWVLPRLGVGAQASNPVSVKKN